MYPELSEAERFPLLTPTGRRLLNRMRQHPRAPLWNWPNGEQLNARGLEQVQKFARALEGQSSANEVAPDWLQVFVDHCLTEVPYYRRRHRDSIPFEQLPTCRRSDLAARVWDFVPDDVSLEDLVVFSSSGTTGYPMRTPHSPASAACGIPLLERALAQESELSLPRGPEQVALTNVAAYRDAFTTAIVVAYLEEAGCVRVNLDPTAWREPSDCPAYIDEWNAPVWLGDPTAFSAMAALPLRNGPRAIVSSIMHLSDALAEKMRRRWGCPVLDLYALTEAGIVAVRTEQGHLILPSDLYVEILNDEDRPCMPGERGEITLTGGRNPYLPLLRYRTGDFASLNVISGQQYLQGLAGRIPQSFLSYSGRMIHSMEVNRIVRRYPVLHYSMQQGESGLPVFHVSGPLDFRILADELKTLFGGPIEIVRKEAADLPRSGR